VKTKLNNMLQKSVVSSRSWQ